jgi:aminoglycoside phosphotransferase (APT) family kinase protein
MPGDEPPRVREPPGDVGHRIGDWLAGKLGVTSVMVDELHRHDEGFSWQTYTLRAGWRDPATDADRVQGFAVRVEPVDGLLAPYDIVRQYRIHRLVLDHSEVPMAKLFWLELEPDPLGMPFYVMERVAGQVPVQWRPNDPRIFPSDDVRRSIGLHFVDIAAQIHGIDWRGADAGLFADPGSAEQAAAKELERWVAYYEEYRLVELPLVREAILWLRANIRCSGRLVLCHGDWRIGNFMVRGNRIVAVFDWELADLSDPVQYLAYAGLPLFRGRDPRLSHLLEKHEYLDRYAERTGLEVADDVFQFWTVHGLLKATASHVRGCRAFQEGRASDLRLAAMDHRTIYLLRHLSRAISDKAVR